jgi:hypothetical protein
MDQVDITASPKLRGVFVAAGVLMLALWGLSLVPPIQNWHNPNEDGFSYVALFWATITCLPVGLFLLGGAVAGRGRHVARARVALLLACALLFLVVAFLIFQYFANSMGGS